MNDREDFAPSIRNASWWSGDSRKAANGRANDAIMEKIGLKPIPDLSGIEAVQMGHVMQPVIGRLAQDKLKIELKDADYALTHPKESWLRSHFDFISADGRTLVEAKNYNASVKGKFDADSNTVPAADLAQCIHEAAVHNVDRVILAVLFGGQELQTFDFTISQEQKDQLIKDMAVYWGHVVTRSPMEPQTTEQAKLLYATDDGSSITCSERLEQIAYGLKRIKENIKDLEQQEEQFTIALQSYIQGHSSLVSVDGNILATWKQTKPSKRFNSDLFKQAYPDLYNQFIMEAPGSRRFLLK